MLVSILVDDPNAWMVPYAKKLKSLVVDPDIHCREPVFSITELSAGQICFFLGCTKLVPPEILERHDLNLVVHESDLPKGRGWSPVQWQILEGKNEIPMVIFEAAKQADAGPIWLRDTLVLNGTELLPEIRAKQGQKTIEMVLRFLNEYRSLRPTPQTGEASVYRRRSIDDDRLDITKSIAQQFDNLRIVSNDSYPAWFEFRGRRYKLKIEAVD